MELFRKIQNYNNYSISNMGNVRNDRTNRILQPEINNKGYYTVNLNKNGKMKTMRVHRLIAVAFLNNPDGKPCIDHTNNDKLNNNMNIYVG
jgi:hypothetical protein